MKGRIVFLSTVSLAVVAMAAHPAAAQTAAAAPAASTAAVAPDANSADIIVTARKRQESILRVPVVETVLTPEVLQRQQVVTLNNVAQLTPGVLLGQAPLEVGTQVSIRGIGTTSLDPGIDQSISLNLDGLQLSQGMAYSVGLFDMAQVEVLKGPQALFFGKNSPGGVISIQTADPGSKFELIGKLSHEFYARTNRAELVASGPVTDTLGLRLAGLYSHSDGYFINKATPVTSLGASPDVAHRFGETFTFYLRGTAVWKPSSDFSARLKANYTRDNIHDGAPFQLASCPDGTVNYLGIPFFATGEKCKGDRDAATVSYTPASLPGAYNNGKPFTLIKQKFGTLELNHTFAPNIELTSVTGFYRLDTQALIGGTYNGGAAAFIGAQKTFSRRDITQEVRLNSDYSGPLNFTLGGFYQDGRIHNDIDLLTNQALGFGTPANLQTGTHDVGIQSLSGFGQLRYKLTSDFEIAAGARYTDEKRNDVARTSFTGRGGPFTTIIPPAIHSGKWSPELTLTYTPTPDLTIFGSLKQGYKSGSYNLIVPLAPGGDNSFGDERIRGGEIGVKTRLADRQLFVNGAFYYYNYSGLQVGVNEATAGTGIPRLITVNAGSARIYGVDLDATFRPHAMPGLRINGAVNWNHARFTSFKGAPCYGGQTFADGCNLLPKPVGTDFPAIAYTNPAVFGGQPYRYTSQDLKGLPLTRAPDWQVNAGVSYEMPVSDRYKVTLGSNGQYSSKLLTNLGPRPDFYQKGYAKINATIALATVDDRWELSLIANNLSDKYTTANCTNLNYAGANLPGVVSGGPGRGPGGQDELHCTFDTGREIWLRLSFHL